MFQKILVANRDEAALRVLRACKELGIKTVIAYSTEDAYSYPVKYADESVCVGPADAEDSYLSVANIMGAAQITCADAIHPGFGFLANSSELARACKSCGITFIGPDADVIETMADKSQARETMKRFGIPTVPGSMGVVESVNEARAFAEKVGYPVLLKASAGSKGRGIYEVSEPAELETQFVTAKAESLEAFGSDDIFLEKRISHARHIEVQVLSDSHGNRVALCEHDCSIQLGRVSAIQESPSTLDEDTRRMVGLAALRVVRALDYRGLATIKFLLDETGKHYFLGMSTSIEAEHLVSETVCGVDIVKEQILVAAGNAVSCGNRGVDPMGHAIQLCIKAENPAAGFKPCAGTVSKVRVPSGIGLRVECAIEANSRISSCYEPTLMTIVACGSDRQEAIARAKRALSEVEIEGIQSTIPFLQKVLGNAAYNKGEVYTDFIESEMGDLL